MNEKHEKVIIPIKKAFKPLRKLLSFDNLIFLCTNLKSNKLKNPSNEEERNYSCNTLLFHNNHIEGLYLFEKVKVGLIVDVKAIDGSTNLAPQGPLLYEDKELNQFDCIFQFVVCKECQNIIGRFVHSTSSEKLMLNDKAVVFIENIKCLKFDELNTSLIDLKSLITLKEKDLHEIRQLTDLNQVLMDTIQHLILDIETTQNYSKISEYNKYTEEILENISRLTRYIEYSIKRINEK